MQSLVSVISCFFLQSGVVTLTDCNSKFGTYIGERRLSPGEQVTVERGEDVRFGQGLTAGRFRWDK